VTAGVIELDGAGPEAGGKAMNLRWLARHGYRVPATRVVPAAAGSDPEAVRAGLDGFVAPGRRYAVRSSARVEDGPGWSFAGQFLTLLDVEGLQAVVEAVGLVRASGDRPDLRPYLERAGIPPGGMEMAVIVQDMVRPAASGVAFSRNPLTGLDEIVVEAVAGRGDALVAGTAAPARWVRRWGAWTTRPPESPVDEAVVEEVATLLPRLAQRYGRPVDVEWVHDGSDLFLVQARPMTGERVAVYSNRIAREVLPGMIKPLVWSVNVPVVNSAWIELFTGLVGPTGLTPDDLARAFSYRAYFNMQAIGDIFERLGMRRDLLEVLLGLPGGEDRPSFRPGPGSLRHLPRMAGMAGRLLRYHRELERELPRLEDGFAEIAASDPSGLDDDALVDRVAALSGLTRRAAFANIVTPLLMNAWSARLRTRLEARGVDPATVDPAAGHPDRARYDPNRGLEALAAALRNLSPEARARLEGGRWAALPGLEAFLDQFGHLSDSGNDFSSVPWREDPAHLVALLDTHGPFRSAGALPLEAVGARRLRRLGGRAARYRIARDRVSFAFTRGYGLFRPTMLEAGRRLAGRGLLDSADDVFFLTLAEVEGLLGRGEPPADPAGRARDRRREMEVLADVAMPEVIFGDEYVPAPAADPDHTLQGLGSSRGVHSGPARIVRSLGDGRRVREGDVVVVPFCDVAWTPVLARAGAVVAESGGMLSHSSIVAREFGIPCVVSVEGATRIPDGAHVRVDGFTGAVVWVPAGVTASSGAGGPAR
jgi:pyruvate,water dikinase